MYTVVLTERGRAVVARQAQFWAPVRAISHGYPVKFGEVLDQKRSR